MLFNIEKCKVMHFGHNNSLVDYCMNSMQLQNIMDKRDLAIVIKWDKQCIAAVKQANKVLGMIKRNFVDRFKDTIMALCKSLVRPHL